ITHHCERGGNASTPVANRGALAKLRHGGISMVRLAPQLVNNAIGSFRLPYGRHRGRLLTECPVDYLIWFADEHHSPTIRLLARQAIGLAEDPEEDDASLREPSAELASVVLPGVTFRWWKVMKDEYGDDPLALAVVDRGLEHLKQLCTEYTGKDWPVE